jgi:hypothetical protein
MLPPGVKGDWEANPPWVQAMMIAYDQIRSIETNEQDAAPVEALIKVLAARG